MAKLTRKQLAGYIAQQIHEGADAKVLADTIAKLLIAEKRTRELPQIMRDVRALRARRDGVLEVDATSATPLTRDHIDSITRLFAEQAQRVIVHQTIDKGLIGGIKLDTAEAAVDLSVRGRLEALHKRITA